MIIKCKKCGKDFESQISSNTFSGTELSSENTLMESSISTICPECAANKETTIE